MACLLIVLAVFFFLAILWIPGRRCVSFRYYSVNDTPPLSFASPNLKTHFESERGEWNSSEQCFLGSSSCSSLRSFSSRSLWPRSLISKFRTSAFANEFIFFPIVSQSLLVTYIYQKESLVSPAKTGEIVICDLRLESKWRSERSMRDISVYFIISVPAAIIFLDYDRVWRTKGNDGLIFHNLHGFRYEHRQDLGTWFPPCHASWTRSSGNEFFSRLFHLLPFACVCQKIAKSLCCFFRKFWKWTLQLTVSCSSFVKKLHISLLFLSYIFPFISSTNYSTNRLPHKRINFSSIRRQKKKRKRRKKEWNKAQTNF